MAKDGDYKDEVLSTSEMYSREKLPVVLSIQPTRFRILKEPAALRNWENRLRSQLGLSGQFEVLPHLDTCCDSECPSIPASGDNLDTDDCDID
jgi:hypothetical protein